MKIKVLVVLFVLMITISVLGQSNGLKIKPHKDGIRKQIPHIEAKSAVLIERLTGKEIFAKDKNKRLAPASLTKVMTALIAIETGSLQEVVAIGEESVMKHSQRIGLESGDTFTLRDLIAAMLITSANDACLAVANHIGKSESGFVKMMNKKAFALKLRNTHFTNPCGHDNPKHYSTAADLATLAEEALKDNVFAIIVRIPEVEITTTDQRKSFKLYNTNRLLLDPDVTGVKTGFTNKAGHCLIVTVFKDGKNLLLVGLNFKDRWQEAMEMINYGLEIL